MFSVSSQVNQYVSRAEELKALVRLDNKISFEAAKSTRNILIGNQSRTTVIKHDKPAVTGHVQIFGLSQKCPEISPVYWLRWK